MGPGENNCANSARFQQPLISSRSTESYLSDYKINRWQPSSSKYATLPPTSQYMATAGQTIEAAIGGVLALFIALRVLFIQICPPGGGPRPARNRLIVGILVPLACADASLCAWFFHAERTGQPSEIAFDTWRGAVVLMPVVALVWFFLPTWFRC